MKEVLIEIKQDRPGFDSFFGTWVCQDDLNIIIDVGPANTAGRLLDSLLAMGIDRVDYVLLTHIHIDHAGGLADLLAHYSMAKVVCHEKAIEHLIDPSKLWAGSLKAIGKIAEMYGPPRPVSRERLIPHTECKIKGLTVIETPGHAIHHLCFNYKDRLFAGEAGGNYLIVGDMEYLRPATPPRFFLDICLKSLYRLLELKDQPICYAHFGKGESSHRLLKIFRDQLMLWNKIIHEEIVRGNKDLILRCRDKLLENDTNLKAFNKMDGDIQKRELFFMENAIKGFVGYLGENAGRVDR